MLLTRRHPNIFPSQSAPYKIAFVGDAAGEEDIVPGWRTLQGLIQDAGMSPQASYVGNLTTARISPDDLESYGWVNILGDIEELKADLAKVQPNIIVPLGSLALHPFKTQQPFPFSSKKKNLERYPIGDWRGSLFVSEGLIPGYKCMPAYAPAYLNRVYSDTLISRYDFRRARSEATFPSLTLPTRNCDVDPTVDKIIAYCREIKKNKTRIGTDIEGYVNAVSCLSIATSTDFAFIVPFESMGGDSFWENETDEAAVWGAVASVLCDPEIPKVLQSGLYDRFVLAWGAYRLLIRGVVIDDSMLRHWEHQCEMPKALDFQTSFYTRTPYYKGGRHAEDAKTFWTYCCYDSMVTLECDAKAAASITGSGVSHYEFNRSLLNPVLYMEYRGINLDTVKRDKRIDELKDERDARQEKLNRVIGWDLNVKSPDQVKRLLYEDLGLPPQKTRGKNSRITSDYAAILTLAHRYPEKKSLLLALIRLQEVRKRISDLETLTTDEDGRIRFAYNLVGSATGRTTCSECPTGSGTNGQTIVDASKLFESPAMRAGARDLLCADYGFDMFQCDLSGADGWTVAAHCARLGDKTMLEDLLAGLKIPRVIAAIVEDGVGVNSLSRDLLRARTELVDKDSHLYFSCKQVQHGTNYGMQPKTVALRVFLESYGEVYISEALAAQYQRAYLCRYRGLLRWHDWVREQVRRGFMISATGHKRIILGRRESEDTVKELLADEPQENTTYATNLALRNLWTDRLENWYLHKQGNLNLVTPHVEPLHQVHDALLGQWHKSRREWAIAKVKSYFDNTIRIAGMDIKIPFDGKFGPSWGDLKAGKI